MHNRQPTATEIEEGRTRHDSLPLPSVTLHLVQPLAHLLELLFSDVARRLVVLAVYLAAHGHKLRLQGFELVLIEHLLEVDLPISPGVDALELCNVVRVARMWRR